MTTMPPSFTAFAGDRRIAAGPLDQVALAACNSLQDHPTVPVLVFSDATGAVVDLDLRGGQDAVAARYAAACAEADATQPEAPARGPGRPLLGVVPREVTLLPRHWDWLATQPGGVSAALRRLVEEARRTRADADRARAARDAAYRFMAAMAGDYPGFEAASRALFGGDSAGLARQMAAWPADVRDYVESLVAALG